MSTSTQPVATPPPRPSARCTAGLIVRILAVLALAIALHQLSARATKLLSDLRYGTPRHTSVQLPHSADRGDPTTIMALNLDGQISVLIFPAGAAEHPIVLEGPYLIGTDGADAVPRLELVDADADGQVDLLLTVRGETIIYLRRNDTFRLITPQERATLPHPSGK